MRPVRRVLPLCVLSGGCAAGVGDPVTRQGGEFRDLWSIFLPIAVGVVVLVWSLVLFSVVRYRRRDDAVPDQRQYRIGIEIAYTVIPLVVVIGLFALSVRAEGKITGLSNTPDERITVVGFQWGWEFEYRDHGFTVAGTAARPPLLVLPVGETTQLSLVAKDVNHSFWVPEFLSKRDLIPGIDNTIDIDPTTIGGWIGHCAEFCGLDHWQMSFEVMVVPRDVYERWLVAAAEGTDPYSIPRPEVRG